METAEMIKENNLRHSFEVFALRVDGKKCAKSLEIINPIRHFEKNGIDVLQQTHFARPVKVHCFNNVYDRTRLHLSTCVYNGFRVLFPIFVVATRQILIECQDEGKNFFESLLFGHKQNLHSQSKKILTYKLHHFYLQPAFCAISYLNLHQCVVLSSVSFLFCYFLQNQCSNFSLVGGFRQNMLEHRCITAL